MSNKLILLGLIGLLMTSVVNAFPLSGHSGQANITVFVFGTILEDIDSQTSRIYVDMGASNGYMGTVALVDSEDKFYNQDCSEGWSKERLLVPFDVPKGTVIKRLKFEPEFAGKRGEPFSIEWEAIPEISEGGVGLKFYGTKQSVYYANKNERDWSFDVKLTNEGEGTMPVMARDFAIVDQYGWEYDYANNHPAGAALDLGQLTPGESMRTSIVFSRISGLSRPVTLRYKGLGLDISAWT